MPSQRILRLYPPPPGGAVSRPYEELGDLPPDLRDPTRPYVLLNTVSSVDAQISAGGKSYRLGSAVDRAAMRYLRSKAEAVMIGANTLRAERLSLGLDDGGDTPDPEQPRAIILSESGDVPLRENLISCRGQEVSILTTRPKSVEGAELIVAPANEDTGGVDLAGALMLLKREYAVDVLLVEGGPTLDHALISRGLVDELFLTLAPVLLGSGGTGPPSGLTGHHVPQDSPSGSQPLLLLGAYLADDEVFLRYRVRQPL